MFEKGAEEREKKERNHILKGGEEHSQVGRSLVDKSKDWRIVALNWTSTTLMLLQSFGYGLILL